MIAVVFRSVLLLCKEGVVLVVVFCGNISMM